MLDVSLPITGLLFYLSFARFIEIRIPFNGIKIKKRKIKKSFRPYLIESPKN